MLNDNTKMNTTRDGMDLSFFQRILSYVLFFIIPWFVIPLPWDTTEQVRVTFFLVISLLILLLEFVKWIWDGKITMLRSSLDKIVFVLLTTFVISSIFALDKWTSIWGMDGRLGTGLLSIFTLMVIFFIGRGFLSKKEYVLKSIELFLLGLSTTVVLSFLTVLKVNVWGWIPYAKELFLPGLPLTFYSNELILISGVLIFLGTVLVIAYLREKKVQKILLPFVGIFLGFVSIVMFSMMQGVVLPILIAITVLLTSLLLFIKLEKGLRFLPVILSVLSVISLIFSIGLQYDSFKNAIVGESYEVVTPINLASDLSWNVSSGVIVNNFFRGLVGLGNDSFSIAYNQFKPSVPSVISLGSSSFVASSNEVFTTLANRGIVGVVVWLLVGLAILKLFVSDISSKTQESLLLLLLEISTILMYLGSFFVSYSFLLYFVFFVSLLFVVLMRNHIYKQDEQFILKFWAVNVGGVSQDVNKTISSVNWFLTGVMVLVVFSALMSLGSRTVSVLYAIRAEAYSVEENRKFAEKNEEISLDQKEEYFGKMISYYDKALSYDSTNPIFNRKAASTALDMMSVLTERYKNASEEEKTSILSEISNWKNVAIDLSREAINTSSYTYPNWYVRASMYTGFLSIGLSDYGEDALFALQRCIQLNPLDFQSYYLAGQIYMIKEDYEKALSAFASALSINGQHVQSLVLSANILNEQGDTKNAISYLEAAKKILEVNKLEKDPLYENIVKNLEELGAGNSPVEESSEKKEEESLTDDIQPLE